MFQKIIINSEWYAIPLCILVGLSSSFWLYYRNKKNKDVSKTLVYGLALLRFLSTGLIAFLLLTIFLRHRHNETQNPIVLLAIDNSSSMTGGADSIFVKTIFLKDLEALQDKISEKFTVKTILFGDRTRVATSKPDFSEKETDMEDLVNALDNNYSNQNVGALILVSDGIYNKGSSPVIASEKLNYPIYTVAMGDTSEPTDLLIQKIDHNQVAYFGNNFPVEITVRSKKYKGREATLSLLRNGIEKGRQNIKITSSDFLSTYTFSLNAETGGLVKYTARLSVLEGEKNVLNNVQSFVMEIIDNREKVLLLVNYPHPDVAALKEAISAGTVYDLEYGLASEFKKPLKAYSLVILPGAGPNQAALIKDCVTDLIPYWIVNPATTENLPGVRITGPPNRQNDAEPIANSTFGLFTVSDGLKKFMKSLPAVKTPFGNYVLNNTSSTLINQRIGVVETENPILLFTEINGIKAGVFLGDGLWKWKMRDFEEHGNHALFNELVSKSVQYLSVKSDKSFFRVTAPKLINENEGVTLDAEVYNKSYELITDPDVTLQLSNVQHKKFNYTFSKTSDAYRLNIGILPPGEYTYEAHVKINNEVLTKKGLLVVKEVVSEKINTVADHSVLFQLSHRSNGKMYSSAQLDLLKNDLFKNELIKPITYSQTSTSPLIDLKWLFWLPLFLFSMEWFLRKRFFSI